MKVGPGRVDGRAGRARKRSEKRNGDEKMTEKNFNEPAGTLGSGRLTLSPPVITQGQMSGFEFANLGIDITMGEIGHGIHEREIAGFLKKRTESPIFEARKWNWFVLQQAERRDFLVALRDQCRHSGARSAANERTAKKADVEIQEIEAFFDHVHSTREYLRDLRKNEPAEYMSFYGECRIPDPWTARVMQLSGFGALNTVGKRLLKAVSETADENGSSPLEWIDLLRLAVSMARRSFGLPEDVDYSRQYALRAPGGRVNCPFCGGTHHDPRGRIPDGFHSPRCRNYPVPHVRPTTRYHMHTVPDESKGAFNEG